MRVLLSADYGGRMVECNTVADWYCGDWYDRFKQTVSDLPAVESRVLPISQQYPGKVTYDKCLCLYM